MRFVLLLLISLITLLPARSQHAFYDAQYLGQLSEKYLETILTSSGKINLTEHESRMVQNYSAFFQNRFNPGIDELEINTLKSAIKKYESWRIVYSSGKDSTTIKNALGMSGIASAVSLFSGGKGISLSPSQQTNIIDGITRFYAEEFRKAQTITFMQAFKKTLGKYGELQVFFPATYAKIFNTDPSRFPDLGTEYKNVFNQDMEQITDNLIKHIDKHSATLNQKLESQLTLLNEANIKTIRANAFYKGFKIARDISSRITHNFHPVELLYYIDKTYYDKEIEKGAKNVSDSVILALHAINLLQQNLLDSAKAVQQQASNYWITLHDFKQLNSKRDWLNFAGLLYQQDKDFFSKYIFNASGKLTKAQEDSLITSISTKTFTVLSALDEWQSLRLSLTDDKINDHFSAYLKFSLKLVEAGNQLLPKPINDTRFKKYLRISDCVINLYDNSRKKDYSNHVYYTLRITNELFAANDTYFAVLNSLERYGAFMSDIVLAKNPEEVKNCIRKYAAPPTSFILKREYAWTFSVTGQPGYFLSTEKMDGNANRFEFVSGITLPIGFELTRKTGNKKTNGHSIGLFAQVVDLGAVLNFRVSDTLSTLPDKIELGQVFSPGGSITFGLKNSPVSFGIGYQYTPQLRKVTTAGGNELFPNGHRVFFRMSWDIPMLNIFRSKRK